MNNKRIEEILGDWRDPLVLKKFSGEKNHKFLNRNNTIKSNWKRINKFIPELLITNQKYKILDIGCGNGSTLEILRYFGHDVIGMDYTPGFDKNNWLYKPLIESQELKCIVHDGSVLPYPFKDKEFDFIICFGVITFFKPITIWQNVLNEFSRISKNGFLIGVNVGSLYDDGKKYLETWNNSNFKLDLKENSIYKWNKK